MRRTARGLLCLATLVLAAGQARAGQPSFFFTDEARQPVKAQFVVEHDSVQTGGTTKIGILFSLKDGWHIYGDKPGDAGMPTIIEWTLSPGASAGPVHWPPPEEFVEAGDIHTFGYTKKVVGTSILYVDPSVNPPQAIELKAKVRWVACHDVCVPGGKDLEATIPISDAPPAPSHDAPLFE